MKITLFTTVAALLVTLPAHAADGWWNDLNDPALADLIDEAIEKNNDIGVATQRVYQADALAGSALSPIFPTFSFDLGINTSPYSPIEIDFPEIPGVEPKEEEELSDVIHTASALVNMRLDADIFGRTVSAFAAARQDAQASREDRVELIAVIATRLASAWYDRSLAVERIAIIEQQLESNQALLELLQLRYESSGGSALDVLQQRQQLAATKSLLPGARSLLRLREHQLAILIGRDPAQGDLAPSSRLPEIGAMPEGGSADDLLQDRPDLRASAAREKAAKARKTNSILQLLPSVQITANGGRRATHLEEWQDDWAWGVGAGLSVPLFAGTVRHQGQRQAEAGYVSAKRALSQATLQARMEVENARTTERGAAAQLAARDEQLTAAKLAYDESREQYITGLTSYLSVLTSLTALQNVQLSRLQAHRDLVGARISLYDALGGAWTSGGSR